MGFFGRKRAPSVPHPRKEPRFDGPLTLKRLEQIFQDCVDFTKRPVSLGEGGACTLTLCYLSGMVKMERVSDYVLRPLAQDEALARCGTPRQAMEEMMGGALYNLSAAERTTLDEAAFDLVAGWCLMFFPGESAVLSLFVGTEEKRSISSPSNETVLKGSRDAFVESLRTNTSIVRRHLKTPELRIREQVVGRQSVTSVDILYIEGLTNPHLVEQVAAQLADIDIDAVLATGNIEEYIVPAARTAFPLVQYTERSDRFCAGLAEGRVGILIDGLPLGYLAPGVLGDFLQAPQDKSESWLLASALTLLRYLCMLGTLLLPALYVAMVTFHQEMIPTRLALSIIAAKQDVPFAPSLRSSSCCWPLRFSRRRGYACPSPSGRPCLSSAAWWWAARRWRPRSSPPRCSSWWPSRGSPDTPCPLRRWRAPCASGGSCWPCWPARRACSAWWPACRRW